MRTRWQRWAALTLMTATGCGMLAAAGRMGTVDGNTVETDLAAKVEAQVQAALVQWKSTVMSEISAELHAQFGDRVGGDQVHTRQTTDSLTSMILAGGLIAAILVGLALHYRGQSRRASAVTRRLIGSLEEARERQPCDCGHCADCIVRKMKGRGDAVGKWLHQAVKAATDRR